MTIGGITIVWTLLMESTKTCFIPGNVQDRVCQTVLEKNVETTAVGEAVGHVIQDMSVIMGIVWRSVSQIVQERSVEMTDVEEAAGVVLQTMTAKMESASAEGFVLERNADQMDVEEPAGPVLQERCVP